jgi:hypothetical protein
MTFPRVANYDLGAPDPVGPAKTSLPFLLPVAAPEEPPGGGPGLLRRIPCRALLKNNKIAEFRAELPQSPVGAVLRRRLKKEAPLSAANS